MATEAADTGFWDLDLSSGQLTWSPRCSEIFGVPEDTPLRYEDFLAHLHPLDLKSVNEAVHAALAQNGPGKYDIEYRVIRPDGQTRWASAQRKAFFELVDEERKAVRFIGTILHRTEQRRSQEELLQARIAQESANAAQRFLLHLADSHRTATNGRDIMQISAKTLGEHLNVGRVGSSETSADMKSMCFETGWADGNLKLLSGSVPMEHWSRATLHDFVGGRTVVYSDVRNEPTLLSEVDHDLAIEAVSVVAVPGLARRAVREPL